MSDAPKGEGRWTMVAKPTDHHGPAAGGGHHEDVPGAQENSVRAGHEPDQFNARGVIFIPIGVMIAAALSYGLVTLLFGVFTPGKLDEKGANPQTVAENDKPYDTRVTRISSQDPDAPVKQPRLEWMRTIEQRKDRSEPEFYRSFRAADAGNSPEIRPEDLRPENFVDWKTGKKVLSGYEWVDQGKGVARIPVNEAIHILASQGKLKPKTPGPHPTDTTSEHPKQSNGGQAETQAPEANPHKDEHKKEEPKKDGKH
jgi:hypothetical protein